jgi:hypothetical protein
MELTVITRLLIYTALAAVGAALYFGVDYLPESWRAWLKGKKTHIVGIVALVGPEIADILTQVQELGLLEYAPGPWQKIITQGLGVMVLVARLRTNREQEAA